MTITTQIKSEKTTLSQWLGLGSFPCIRNGAKKGPIAPLPIPFCDYGIVSRSCWYVVCMATPVTLTGEKWNKRHLRQWAWIDVQLSSDVEPESPVTSYEWWKMRRVYERSTAFCIWASSACSQQRWRSRVNHGLSQALEAMIEAHFGSTVTRRSGCLFVMVDCRLALALSVQSQAQVRCSERLDCSDSLRAAFECWSRVTTHWPSWSLLRVKARLCSWQLRRCRMRMTRRHHSCICVRLYDDGSINYSSR